MLVVPATQAQVGSQRGPVLYMDLDLADASGYCAEDVIPVKLGYRNDYRFETLVMDIYDPNLEYWGGWTYDMTNESTEVRELVVNWQTKEVSFSGWIFIDGEWYYMQSSGVMDRGWTWIDGSCYYFNSSGHMLYDTWVDGCYLNSSGVWDRSVA